MFSWFTGGSYSVACAVASVDFFAACFLKAISMSTAIFLYRCSCTFSSWALRVRGRTRRVSSSLARSMIDASWGVFSWGASVVSPQNFWMMIYYLTAVLSLNWRWVRSGLFW